MPRPDRENPSGGSLDSGGGGGGQRVVDPSKVAVAPSGIPLLRPGSGSRPDSGNNSNRSSNNSSRDSTRSSISREEAKETPMRPRPDPILLRQESWRRRRRRRRLLHGCARRNRPAWHATRPTVARRIAPCRGPPPRMNPAVLQAVSAASLKTRGRHGEGCPSSIQPQGWPARARAGMGRPPHRRAGGAAERAGRAASRSSASFSAGTSARAAPPAQRPPLRSERG